MDRVRSLISGGRSRNSGSHNRQARQSTPRAVATATAVNSYTNRNIQHSNNGHRNPVSPNTDDQDTIIESSDDNDVETMTELRSISTFVSDSNTIGDLQRQGYVNRCPQFNSVRSMPLISILLNKGFYAFPSDKSFKLYIENKRKLDDNVIDPNNNINNVIDLGIPLFHGISNNLIRTLLSTNKKKNDDPIMKFYKFELIIQINGKQKQVDLSIYPNYEIISQNSNYKLIKFEFCNVFKEIDKNDSSRIIHTFKFYNNKSYPMINYTDKKDIDTVIDDNLTLRWFGFSGFASPFGSNDIKLLVMDDNMPSYMDNLSEDNTIQNQRSLASLPIWASYSDDNISIIPKKRTLKLANFKIKEMLNTNYQTNDGILNIPWNTQVLTCMCMLLHEYESRKERRHNNIPDNAYNMYI